MHRIVRLSAAALMLLSVTFASGPSLAAKPAYFTVAVSNLHSVKGQLIVCLWRDKPGFPSCEKSKSALRRIVKVTAPRVDVMFPLPASGRYAITVVHDEDGNGKMKRNFIGMPAEGVGISNNPGGMPGFAKSLVDIASDTTVDIRMKYLFD